MSVPNDDNDPDGWESSSESENEETIIAENANANNTGSTGWEMFGTAETNKAMFYPCRIDFTRICIGGQKTIATNDAFASSYEIRHFISVSFLRTIEGGEDLLANLVDPIPPVNANMIGPCMQDQRVLGMIPINLKAKAQTINSAGTTVKLTVILDQILVIDELPVPFHLSVRRLGESGKALRTFHSDRCLVFNVSNVPVQYHQHPFWNSDGRNVFIGLSNNTEEVQTELLNHANQAYAGVRGIKKECYKCQATAPLFSCAKCRCIYYCSKEHQTQDWKRHKVDCKSKESS